MTVGSGVTIGSMTAPVNAQGIYLFAEQPANTGASPACAPQIDNRLTIFIPKFLVKGHCDKLEVAEPHHFRAWRIPLALDVAAEGGN